MKFKGRNPSPVKTEDAMSRLLEVTDLRVAYGAVIAVNAVSLTVNAGEVVGLIGPNGAGSPRSSTPSRGR
jgi:ABC-type uncharacterized transport system ATPase subunit